MTLIVGALCDADDRKHTANIILCADRRVTFSQGGIPVSSNPNGSKLFDLPCGFYGGISDDLTHGHVFVSKLADGMRNLDPADPALLDRVKLSLADTTQYAQAWMVKDILKQYGVSHNEWLHDKKLADRQQIQEELRTSRPLVEIIVAGFSRGHPVLLYTDCVNIQEQTGLGFYTGGRRSVAKRRPKGFMGAAFAGAAGDLALYWLNFRQQALFMSAQRTCFHMMEAKRFAHQNQTIGGETVILFLRPNEDTLALGYPPYPSYFDGWSKEFWFKKTDRLQDEDRNEFLQAFKQSISQKSKQVP